MVSFHLFLGKLVGGVSKIRMFKLSTCTRHFLIENVSSNLLSYYHKHIVNVVGNSYSPRRHHVVKSDNTLLIDMLDSLLFGLVNHDCTFLTIFTSHIVQLF